MMSMLQFDALPTGRLSLKVPVGGEMVEVPISEAVRCSFTAPQGVSLLSVPVGVPFYYQLTSWHFCDDYAVATDNGTVELQDAGTIVYTPATVGAGGFSVNGYVFALTIVDNVPAPPSIEVPAPNSTIVQATFAVDTGNFQARDPAMSHYATHWQIATDAGFTQLVVDEVSTTSLTSYTVTGLAIRENYFVRAKFIGRK